MSNTANTVSRKKQELSVSNATRSAHNQNIVSEFTRQNKWNTVSRERHHITSEIEITRLELEQKTRRALITELEDEIETLEETVLRLEKEITAREQRIEQKEKQRKQVIEQYERILSERAQACTESNESEACTESNESTEEEPSKSTVRTSLQSIVDEIVSRTR